MVGINMKKVGLLYVQDKRILRYLANNSEIWKKYISYKGGVYLADKDKCGKTIRQCIWQKMDNSDKVTTDTFRRKICSLLLFGFFISASVFDSLMVIVATMIQIDTTIKIGIYVFFFILLILSVGALISLYQHEFIKEIHIYDGKKYILSSKGNFIFIKEKKQWIFLEKKIKEVVVYWVFALYFVLGIFGVIFSMEFVLFLLEFLFLLFIIISFLLAIYSTIIIIKNEILKIFFFLLMVFLTIATFLCATNTVFTNGALETIFSNEEAMLVISFFRKVFWIVFVPFIAILAKQLIKNRKQNLDNLREPVINITVIFGLILIILFYVGIEDYSNILTAVSLFSFYFCIGSFDYIPNEKDKLVKKNLQVKLLFKPKQEKVIEKIINILHWWDNEKEYIQVTVNTKNDCLHDIQDNIKNSVKLHVSSTVVPYCKDFLGDYQLVKILSVEKFKHLIFENTKC